MTVFYKPYIVAKVREIWKESLSQMKEIDRIELSDEEIRQLNWEILTLSKDYQMPLFASHMDEVMLYGIKLIRGNK